MCQEWGGVVQHLVAELEEKMLCYAVLCRSETQYDSALTNQSKEVYSWIWRPNFLMELSKHDQQQILQGELILP